MNKQVVVIDYESNIGLRHIDQIDELEIPIEIKQDIKRITKENLNEEIQNKTPVFEYLFISGACIICILYMYFSFEKKSLFRIIGSISFIFLLLVILILMVCSLRKNQNIITEYIDLIEQESVGCIIIELIYEDNVEYFPKKKNQKLQQNQVLVAMKFNINNENLQNYLDNQNLNESNIFQNSTLTIEIYND